ncbi:trafficking kinesin-binding protein 2 [Canis lupus baileyi]|uniref:Trafficking kinesin protein 2 n=3 Tax=Canis lupus TaxID=9612 RepID=A0A8C0TGN6_CANLF|nr:trafficking kinesin-binding protein 2 [Canis lupus familiaris]XP_005640598.1 trafficking kinesin-binding protein 2 [Canis lupus familiaris]XP_025297408.1 trafficking kinesin-binding protein 2 [Canis lupus dingo]XP_025297410.1 trafficking kinesin-binding protein 2 [Canis lupus dingo]XP_038303524.1 trafficking kinesin-binding protein 2 [Canis lupus familiaris]XP_038303525.1 trafficking kinesin-binding protein 2 [Canis lupus familiaris]XP_038441283.1 trafficking kinesin-binding protein 2 [Can|eukprot:XP_005640597.1 trafficking kinesin-binding protein 2 [Canis lupus familiaris]
MSQSQNAIFTSPTGEENLMNINHRDSESITDVCSNEDLPEVELVSLLEEQLPQYKLRVDSLFLYENQDWTRSPHQQHHASDALSPVLAEETFHYMILGTDRVEQMTKTYNDIDMVTHLLAERDRDLELAARIGQALLKRNHVLSEQNEALEEQLGQAFDQVNQLQHELSKKDELLRIVSIASEESETDSSCSTPLRFNESFSLSQGLLQLDMLQEKLKELEEENMALRSKACHIKTETITYEEKEQQLVNDCVKELRETNAQMSRMTEELSGKSDELIRYQEEISSLLSQIVDLQHKVKEHVIEKEELRLHLQASKDAQRQLTMELHELQDRNMECLGMLHESQEEIKELRSRSGPSAHLYLSQSYGAFSGESLAAEIEGTMRKKLSLDEESSLFKQKAQQKRIFDTVKVANDTRGRSIPFPALLPIPGSNRSSVIMTAKPFESGLQQTEEKTLLNQGSNSEEVSENVQKVSQAGPSGDSDLATALHRLSLRRQNYLSEKQFFAEEWERKIQVLADQKEGISGCGTPTESLASLCTDQSEITDLSSATCLRGFMPEKLQIVKPLEGSQTLHHWQQLAQPNLGTILDPRPGVITKGFTQLPRDAIYHLSDLEEDEEEGITFQVEQKPSVSKPVTGIFLPAITSASGPVTVATSNPGKCLSCTNSTFTFTTCRILHPSDITQVTPSSGFPSLSCGSSGSSSSNTAVNSPAMSYRLSIGESVTNRRDSTITFSSTMSLAKLLQERGISAKVYHSPVSENPLLQPIPKALAIPSTPPNSPSHSPCPSPLPFEPRVHLSENFLASRPAETFLQEMYGLRPTRNPPDIGQLKMNLVDRLKRLGIARVIKTPDAQENGRSQEAEVGLQRPDSAVYLNSGSNLLSGLRRNQSLPVMMGSFGTPVCTTSPKMDILKEN